MGAKKIEGGNDPPLRGSRWRWSFPPSKSQENGNPLSGLRED
jgi:hypothetical protein